MYITYIHIYTHITNTYISYYCGERYTQIHDGGCCPRVKGKGDWVRKAISFICSFLSLKKLLEAYLVKYYNFSVLMGGNIVLYYFLFHFVVLTFL